MEDMSCYADRETRDYENSPTVEWLKWEEFKIAEEKRASIAYECLQRARVKSLIKCWKPRVMRWHTRNNI